MNRKFVTSTTSGVKWYTGICWCFEFISDGVEYLGASRQDDFALAVVIECIPGQELKQLRELEQIVVGGLCQ